MMVLPSAAVAPPMIVNVPSASIPKLFAMIVEPSSPTPIELSATVVWSPQMLTPSVWLAVMTLPITVV